MSSGGGPFDDALVIHVYQSITKSIDQDHIHFYRPNIRKSTKEDVKTTIQRRVQPYADETQADEILEVEASRPDFESDLKPHFTKVPEPGFKPGQGLNSLVCPLIHVLW